MLSGFSACPCFFLHASGAGNGEGGTPRVAFCWTGLLALQPGWGGSPTRDGVIDTGATENTAEIVHTNVI